MKPLKRPTTDPAVRVSKLTDMMATYGVDLMGRAVTYDADLDEPADGTYKVGVRYHTHGVKAETCNLVHSIIDDDLHLLRADTAVGEFDPEVVKTELFQASWHVPVLDWDHEQLDLRQEGVLRDAFGVTSKKLVFVPSARHFHVYVQNQYRWSALVDILKRLSTQVDQNGRMLMEPGYIGASLRRGSLSVRTPWHKKKIEEKKIEEKRKVVPNGSTSGSYYF